jgi:hypothetical protein
MNLRHYENKCQKAKKVPYCPPELLRMVLFTECEEEAKKNLVRPTSTSYFQSFRIRSICRTCYYRIGTWTENLSTEHISESGFAGIRILCR